MALPRFPAYGTRLSRKEVTLTKPATDEAPEPLMRRDGGDDRDHRGDEREQGDRSACLPRLSIVRQADGRTAQRGWLTDDAVINTWQPDRLPQFLAKDHRARA